MNRGITLAIFKLLGTIPVQRDWLIDRVKIGAITLDINFRYKRKIWLTEFAKARTANNESVLEHIDEYLPLLEESEIIYRYLLRIGTYSYRSIKYYSYQGV